MIVHPKTKTLIRYIDKDLSEAQAERIRRHLDRCKRCRKAYGILQRIEAVNAPKKDLLDNFKDRIVANLKEAKRVNQPICADIKATIGKVLVFQTGDDEGIEGFPGMGLKKGDTVRLLGDSRALIELNDGSTVYLNKDTEISLPSARYDMAMMVGEIFAMMKPQKKAFEIWTPSAMLGVIGTDFDARVTEKKETILQVLKGKVSFKNESGSTIVKKKHQVEATKDTKPIPKKIKDTQTIYNWTIPMKRKKTERGWIMDKLYLVIPAILAVGILIGGYFVYQEYFAYELPSDYKTSETLNSSVSPGETSSLSPTETSTKPNPLELVSPYTQSGLSWRTRANEQAKIDNAWIDTSEIVTRSDIIPVDEKNGSRVLLTIEDVKVPEGPEEETADRMIGRRYTYLVSPEGKSHSFSTANGKPLEYGETKFYAMATEVSEISGLFLKKQLIPGDQWIEEFENKVPGYPNSYVKETNRYQFEKYEIRDGVEYAIIQAHSTGSVGGGFPWEKVVEPKAIHYVQLDQVNFDQRWEYQIDVESGRLVSGTGTSRSSGIKGTVTSLITGRRVPVKETIEQEFGDLNRTFFTVEYLP